MAQGGDELPSPCTFFGRPRQARLGSGKVRRCRYGSLRPAAVDGLGGVAAGSVGATISDGTCVEAADAPDQLEQPEAAAEFWTALNSTRWERARHIEQAYGFAVCDGDPFKLTTPAPSGAAVAPASSSGEPRLRRTEKPSAQATSV